MLTRYDDVFRVAQDWETFSSELGVGIPGMRARVQECGGTFRIDRSRFGTKLTVTIPRGGTGGERAPELLDGLEQYPAAVSP